MKIAIIGGGASGLAAAVAASKKHQVTLFEKNDRVGKKLLVTGNGRCNLSNTELTMAFKQSNVYNTPFAHEFARLFPYEKLKSFFEGLGLMLASDDEGRVYPFSGHASSVLDVLRFKCEHGKVDIQTEMLVKNIEKIPAGGFFVHTQNGKQQFDKVIFCVGSNAQVKNFNGIELAKGLGLRLTNLSPSLCPIKTQFPVVSLNGTKVKCVARLFKDDSLVWQEDGEVLFREYGLSGISIFNLSAFVARDAVNGIKTEYAVELDLFPNFSQDELCKKFKERFDIHGSQFFVGLLTRRLGEEILKACGEQEVDKDNIDKICRVAKCWRHKVAGLADASNCQVSSGGIDITQLKQDMSVANCDGLYVCGECLDVDGLCGGFNLHFAFASGLVAGASV